MKGASEGAGDSPVDALRHHAPLVARVVGVRKPAAACATARVAPIAAEAQPQSPSSRPEGGKFTPPLVKARPTWYLPRRQVRLFTAHESNSHHAGAPPPRRGGGPAVARVVGRLLPLPGQRPHRPISPDLARSRPISPDLAPPRSAATSRRPTVTAAGASAATGATRAVAHASASLRTRTSRATSGAWWLRASTGLSPAPSEAPLAQAHSPAQHSPARRDRTRSDARSVENGQADRERLVGGDTTPSPPLQRLVRHRLASRGVRPEAGTTLDQTGVLDRTGPKRTGLDRMLGTGPGSPPESGAKR